MLYIASSLPSTAVSHSLLLEQTDPEDISASPLLSLVLAKGNRVEVHDVNASGLTERCELDVWGQIVGLVKAPWDDATKSYFLVLTDAPLARLILLAYDCSAANPSIETISALNLSPPSRSSRHAEFLTGLITCPEHNLVIASLWTGVLSVASVGLPIKKGSRKESLSSKGSGTVELRDSYNLNIKEHNLVSLSFVPSSHSQPMLAFLSLSPTRTQVVQLRSLTHAAQLLTDLCEPKTISAEVCPAARHVLGLPTGLAIIGDEFTSFYDVSLRAASSRLGSSPEAVVKKRKGSVGGSVASATSRNDGGGEVWDVKGTFKLRQGFGTVLASEIISATADQVTLLLGDEFGKISAISFDRCGAGLPSGKSQLTCLGQTSPPTSITYIDAGYVFIGSHCGDSQVIHIEVLSTSASSSSAATQTPMNIMSSPESIRSSPRKGKAKARSSDAFDQQQVIELDGGKERSEVVDVMMNLAPVNDFCVVPEEGGSVSKIITASGASTSNSLRVVRSGVGLDTKLSVQGISDVQNMWPLSSGKIAECDDLLLVSTSTSTVLLEISADGSNVSQVAPTLYSGLKRDRPTLAAGQSAGDGEFVQVTAKEVTSLSSTDAKSYKTDTQIVAACIGASRIVIGESDNRIKMLDTADLSVKCEATTSEEPSSLAVESKEDGLLAVACWDGSVSLYRAADLTAIHAKAADVDVDMDGQGDTGTEITSTTALHTLSTELASYGVSLAFHRMRQSNGEEVLQLLVGQGDGELVTIGVELADDGSGKLSEPGASSLGLLPVRISASRGLDGLEQRLVIAVSGKLTLLYEDRDRLAQSSISRPNLTSAVSIRVPGLGSCLVIAAGQSLTFSAVTSLKKLHVQKTDLEDKCPMKIAHWSHGSAFDGSGPNHLGLGILQSSLDAITGDILELGYFELRDSTTLQPLTQYLLEPTESIVALEVKCMRGHTKHEGSAVYMVGTAFGATEGNMNNVQRGRLLFLKVCISSDDQTWSMKLLGEVNLAGPVYAVQSMGDHVAVASQNKVTIYKEVWADQGASLALNETSSWGSAFVAEHLTILGDEPASTEPRTLVVGDSMRSISTLLVDKNGIIGTEQRDLSTHWVTGLHEVQDDGKAVLISDSNYNLLTLRLGEQIENAARFGLHEHVTRFRSGNSGAKQPAVSEEVKPDIVFSTATGRLGIVRELDDVSRRVLDSVQRNLSQLLRGAGDLDHADYRSVRLELGSKASVGFVDGDFVQRFMSLSAAEQKQVLAGRGVHDVVTGEHGKAQRPEVLRILEAMGQLH